MIDNEEETELDRALSKVVDDSIRKLKKKLKKLKIEAGDDYDDLRRAASELVVKLDACKPYIDNANLMQSLHGIKYNGPTYGEELERLREVLGRRFE
jgi:hypothetical protein